MSFLLRVLDAGVDLVDALPRRSSLAVALVLVLSTVFMLWPELLVDVFEMRTQPIIDSVMEQLRWVVSGEAL